MDGREGARVEKERILRPSVTHEMVLAAATFFFLLLAGLFESAVSGGLLNAACCNDGCCCATCFGDCARLAPLEYAE